MKKKILLPILSILLTSSFLVAETIKSFNNVSNDAIKNEMKEYLSFANINSVAYLEFFKDDSVEQFYQDAKALKDIIS